MERMNVKTVAAFTAYAATIPAANWMINHVGTQAFPGGPHTIPVGFGYQAPSGVLMIGVALAARDVVQRISGTRVALAAIVVGVALSYVVAGPALATASAAAFAIGELADFAVYTPLQRRRLILAVVLSGVVGGIIDSLVFLHIAFGSFTYWQGQVIGKTEVSLAAGLLMLIWRRRAVSLRLSAEGA